MPGRISFIAKKQWNGYYYNMKQKKVLSGAFNLMVVMALSSILAIAVFLVYRTFEKSIESEIFRYTRELEDSVRRTTATEYRRYFLLVDLVKSIGGGETGEAFTSRLEEKAEILNENGELPYLVSSIGYYYMGSAETALEYNFDSREWSQISGIFNKKEMPGGWEYYSAETVSGIKDENIFLAVRSSDDERVIFFRLDTPGFIEHYVRDIVEDNNENFRIEWLRASEENTRTDPEASIRDALSSYRFKPLQVLFNVNKNDLPLIIEIPGFFELRKVMDTFEGRLPEDQNGKPERPGLFKTGFFVKMADEHGSYYYSIEHEAAIDFLETVVIFIMIGVLFILLLFQLEHTRRLRSREQEFVASITHELRTPLTVIRSAADNLSTGIVPPEKLKVYSSLITEQSARLGKMIEEILLYSNFEGKKERPDAPVKIDVSTLLSQIRPGLETLADASGISLHWDLKGLPESIRCYPDVITLVMNNLVSNGVHHAYAGVADEGKKDQIRIHSRILFPDRLQITVEDDGRGIGPRDLKHICKPFYRDSVSRERQEKGSGLGLFITKSKLVLCGGDLKAESPYRRIDGSRPSGCRFTAHLPCHLFEDEELNGEDSDGN